MNKTHEDYYLHPEYGPERRHASKPRRFLHNRRNRIRLESLVSDCRTLSTRRKEDEEGFIEISDMYIDEENPNT